MLASATDTLASGMVRTSRGAAAGRRRRGRAACPILTVHRVESECSHPPPTRWPMAWRGQVAPRQPAVGAASAVCPILTVHRVESECRIRHRHAGHWHDADKSGRGSPPILILADPGNLSPSWPGPCPRALDPGMTRPSAPRRWFVDGRFKPGHDGKATSPRQNENCWRQPSVGAAAARFARSSRFIGLVSGCSHLPRTSRPATSKTHCGPSSRFIGSTPAWSHPPPRPSQPHAEHGPRRHA